MNEPLFIGIDIGGTKIAGGLMTSSGKILARHKIPTPKKANLKQIISLVSDTASSLISQTDLRAKKIQAMGIGIPGLIDPHEGKIIKTPNMGLSGTNFMKEAAKKIRVPLAIGNDVKLGILGEQWLGAARTSRHVVGLFLGTGLGAGVLIDGKLLVGSRGAAGEIGHMIIDVHGPQCSCGNRGCLEAFIGRWAIERDICEAIKNGKRPLLNKLTDSCSKAIKSKLLAKALKRKDPVVTPIVKNVSRILGTACISLRHIFDPELIVLGGGVIEACGDFMIPIVKKTAERDPFFSGLKQCRIVKSQLGDDAIILGAVALARQSLKTP